MATQIPAQNTEGSEYELALHQVEHAVDIWRIERKPNDYFFTGRDT